MKLTPQQREEIKQRHTQGAKVADLVKEYNVSEMTIYRTVNDKYKAYFKTDKYKDYQKAYRKTDKYKALKRKYYFTVIKPKREAAKKLNQS